MIGGFLVVLILALLVIYVIAMTAVVVSHESDYAASDSASTPRRWTSVFRCFSLSSTAFATNIH